MSRKINILVLVGGPVNKLDDFLIASKELDVNLIPASFSDINYSSLEKDFILKVGDQDLADFDIIYIRMVGKRIEDATLVANYAKKKGVKIVDGIYSKELLYPSSISKAHETMKLISGKVPMPRTIYGKLSYLSEIAPKEFGFPFVFKSTTGRKAREVWSPKDEEDMKEIVAKLRELEKAGSRFFAQEFVKASTRYRVFILGGEPVTAVSQGTKWRKRFTLEEKNHGIVDPIPSDVAAIAKQAARACDLDISGVDVLKDDETGELTIIEANAAPSWNLIKKHTSLEVEKEIIKWLIKQI